MEKNIKFLEGVMSPREALSRGDENDEMDLRTGQSNYPRVALFFSIDIVNSTLYKERTGTWPIIIRSLLDEIRRQVCRRDALQACLLWRVIGDETVFVLPVSSRKEVVEVVSSVFEVTQRISISLKSGKFFDALEGQTLSEREIAFLKVQNDLSIKAAAWIAAVNKRLDTPHDNIVFNYSESAHNTSIREYIGKDIDTGFRLKNYTQDRRLVISLELANCLLKEKKEDCLHIIGYDRLKGVWNQALYPIIWFYDANIESLCRKEMLDEDAECSFKKSFRYDEADGNLLIHNYFLRRTKEPGNNHVNMEVLVSNNSEYVLTENMFKVSHAIHKVINDRDLKQKTEYIDSLLNEGDTVEVGTPRQDPLSLHCAVVCCDVKNRSVMIILRGGNHATNPKKWEFGCAHASSAETIEAATVEHYLDTYGVKIELITNRNRQERQPIPIAVYELKKRNCIDKGIIFIGRLIEEKEFRPNTGYVKREWINEAQIDSIKDEEAVSDFRNTIKMVFEHFDEYFGIQER